MHCSKSVDCVAICKVMLSQTCRRDYASRRQTSGSLKSCNIYILLSGSAK